MPGIQRIDRRPDTNIHRALDYPSQTSCLKASTICIRAFGDSELNLHTSLQLVLSTVPHSILRLLRRRGTETAAHHRSWPKLTVSCFATAWPCCASEFWAGDAGIRTGQTAP